MNKKLTFGILSLLTFGVIATGVYAFGPKWSDSDWKCPDTNQNQICDGMEDFDNDGIVNREDEDYIGTNASLNPNFVDEDGNGICDYREDGTTALGGMGRRGGGRWTK